MPKFRQFYLLVWKNWTLGKRSPWRTAFEVFLPLFFILILVILRVWKIKDVPEPDTLYKQFNISTLPKGNLNGKQLNFAYAPNTSDVRVVMGDVIKTLGFNRSRVFGSEKEMVDFLHNEGDVASAFLGGIFFKATPNNDNIVYKIRLSSRARSSKTRRKAFGGDTATSWNTQFTFNVFQLPGPRSKKSTHGGPPDYYGEGFLAIQNAIDMAILRYKKVPFSTDLKMQRFPYPAYIKDAFILVIQQTLPLLLMLSLTVTALYITRDLVHEKERKLKESMKMMGLSGWLHWCAWFTKFFIFLLITVILGSALFTIKFSSNGKVINKSNPILIFVFLLLYAISSIMFCFLVSVFFSKASIATAGGGIIWFFSYTPYFFVSQSYDTMSLSLKLASCLISNCNMGLGAMMIGKFEGRGTGVQWSNLYEGPSVDDDMTLGYVFLMFLADCVLYGTLTWYIEAVFPGEYGTPQPWYFPFLCSYWCGTSKQVEVDSHYIQNGAIVTGVHEKEPASLNAGVKVKRLSKSFSTDKGQKVAVDGVSINMYEGQITVLLGHNGAGKTTLMSMLTGLFPPSSGTAFVNDCNIVDDMSGVRSSLGLCPQHDVLFDRLTVEEHLWFFALMKGLPTKRVALEVDKMIQSVGLQDKRTTQTRALSGGMKRKLSVGIALIAGSKVVMLDEPTSGMDPSARRFTWDLLQQQRQERTILLTTHFMDEADLLGDRIAIMAEGQIKCCGSSLFLKNKYGVGYHMAVVKAASCKVSMVTKVVLQYVPTAQLESNVGAELTYILPSEATGNFEDLFNELESRRDELGINSFGVSVTTMEEVFLKVGEEIDDSLSKALRNEESDNEGENEEDESYKIDVDDTNNLGAFSGSSGTHTSTQHNSRIRLAFQRWYSMFVKRLLHSRRHKLSLISQLVLPLAFTLIALINAKTFPQPEDSPPLSLNVTSFGQNTVLFATSNSSTNLVSAYKNQFIGTNTKPVRVKKSNMSYYLIHKATEMGIGDFNLHYLVAASLEQVQQSVNVIAWFNNQALHAVAITLATVQNGILKSALGFNHSVTTINHPLPRTTKDTVDDLRRNGLGFMISFDILFGMAFLASSFVVFLVQERSNKAKHVQFVSGVDPLSYWTSAYAWDLINFVLPSVSLLILLAAFDVPAYSGANLGYTFLLLMIYGWAVIPLMYLFSFLFNSAATAFVILTTFNIITGLATLMTVFILSIPELDLLNVAEVLKWVFLVLPNYCLGQGLGDIFNNYNTLYYFNKDVDFCLKKYPSISRKTCEDAIKQLEAKAGVVLEFQENYLAWANPGIGRYLVFMAWEGLFFFSVVLFIEFGLLRRFVLWLRSCSGSMRMNYTNFGELSSTSGEHDDDVFEEKRRIAVGADDQDILVIRELTKVYPGRRGHGPLLAVDNLSLGIPMGECFGLLGVNGAGKTTTFRMLTGDEMMTSGTALVDSFDIRSSMGQVRQRIGYCPQFDALIGHMTVREMLYMYARLRGVPERDIQQTVNNLIRSLLLTNHADKLTKSLSGGNKRKLSTAISLVGEPPVVFLDEPTTGMDPVAKRLLWNALCRVRAEGRCIVITSHSMEECDALCTRIAIMVNGRFKCLGSPQHLKTKFGEGYTLIARVGSADTTYLKEFVEETFPGSVLKDEHLSMVHYHITDTRVTWAQIFGAVEKVKLDYDIEDYTISQTTLDQVFLNFARGQRHEDE